MKPNLSSIGNCWNLIQSLVCGFLFASSSFAQTDSTWKQAPEIELSGFADVYYAFDFNQPSAGTRQQFLYNHNRHNEFNLNLGYLKAGVIHSRYRANLALQAGTYTNANYAAEPGVLKHVFEGNIGLALNRKANVWVDVGIFGSHIGFESAVSLDNWTLTRSLLAENSPYYLAGAKLSFKPSDKWEMSALLCNGWQRIQRVQGSSMPSGGTQLRYLPSSKLTLNWSTFVGTDDPDSTRRMRYFNNVYAQWQVSERFGLIGGFDLGLQQIARRSSVYHAWVSPVLIARYSISDRFFIAARCEYYQDPSAVIITVAAQNGFRTSGASLNIDYQPAANLACRIEGRWMHSTEPIFERGQEQSNQNFVLVGSIAMRFARRL